MAERILRVEDPENLERALELLKSVGLSAYEARCFVALIGSPTPLNGYEVAKVSSVPRSAVYESLQKLVARGAALTVSGVDGTGASFVALPVETFVGRLRNQLSGTLDGLATVLPSMSNTQRSSVVAHLTGRAQVRDRFVAVMEKAEANCLLAVWPPGAEELLATADQLVSRGISVTSVIYGEVADFPGVTHVHRFEDPMLLRDALGCRFYVVVSDKREALVGIREGERTWGVWSDDLAIISLTQQFVLQDIVIQEMGLALQQAGGQTSVDRILADHHRRMVEVVRGIAASIPQEHDASAPTTAGTPSGRARQRRSV